MLDPDFFYLLMVVGGYSVCCTLLALAFATRGSLARGFRRSLNRTQDLTLGALILFLGVTYLWLGVANREANKVQLSGPELILHYALKPSVTIPENQVQSIQGQRFQNGNQVYTIKLLDGTGYTTTKFDGEIGVKLQESLSRWWGRPVPLLDAEE